MNQKNENSCIICGSEVRDILLEINEPDRFETHLGVIADDYQRFWVQCDNCGAATNMLPAMSKSRLEELRTSYYEVDFKNSNLKEKFNRVMSMGMDESDNYRRVERVLDFSEEWFSDDSIEKTLLDIGSGLGVFPAKFSDLSSARKLVWDITALEPDPIAADHLNSLKKFKVINELYCGQNYLKDFNLVTLNKIIEHIENPYDVLGNIHDALNNDNGLIYIEVPDVLTTKYRSKNDNILGALHYHLYSPQSLSILVEKAALMPLKIERIFEPSGKITVYTFACKKTAYDNKAILKC